jgi:acetolactate synthase-1/2/3 large subunit
MGKIRVSDYIADFFANKGINQVFGVVGGGAMFLNDSLGHHSQLHCLYNHHEQASAMAAEAYARIKNKPAILCVTSGPGAINALNGVIGAYQDSIPMIVLSGQTKTTLSSRFNHLDVRTLGNQEFDIVSSLDKATKYAEMLENPQKIRYCLEKAYILATSGRPGPCWLDIPLDIQGAYVEIDELEGYKVSDIKKNNGSVLQKAIKQIMPRLKAAKRPVLYAGNGIRIAGGAGLLHQLAEKLEMPVVTCWNSIDLMATDDKYYCGRGGTMGDRPGNFAVQNSDFLLCIGTRLNVYQVGYNVNTWARSAYVVVVDVDSKELHKPTMRVDFPVCADAVDFINAIFNTYNGSNDIDRSAWLTQCSDWKKTYPVVQARQYAEIKSTNVYAFIDRLSHLLSPKAVTVVTNGSASVVGSQTYYIKDEDRFIMNCEISSMGYGLPASIGACVANNRQSVVCIEGDGSIMMNLQELQTMVTNKLPIKLFIINNDGYHQIRQTQNNVFHDGLVGVGPDSGDLGFPDFKKLAGVFNIPYVCIEENSQLEGKIKNVLASKTCILCEVFASKKQIFEPKSATKRLPDGTLISPPLEDLAPFLPREELKKNMYISMIDEKQKENWK